MRKIKILHIQVLPKLSGVQKISLEIFQGLSNDEYDKWILFSDETDSGDKETCIRLFEKAGAKVIFSSSLKRSIGFKDIPAIIELYRLCKQEKFDVVHTHSTKPGIIGRIAATCASIPLVIHTVHGLSFHKFVKFPLWQFYWLCEMFSSFFCDRIVLVNKYYSKYFSFFRKKVATIYNGIDFSSFNIENDLGLNSDSNLTDRVKVLYVGRLDNQKDPLTLLKAAHIVCNEFPNTLFSIVGDGEKYQECLDFIELNNLSNNIKLEGWQSNVSQYYKSHDIFAMSSIYESFGLIFLEAGFFRLPVVATNVEGIPEVVDDNVTGLLSKPREATTLANNIIRLLKDKNLILNMGDSAHERVTTLFSAEIMVRKYKNIYNGIH